MARLYRIARFLIFVVSLVSLGLFTAGIVTLAKELEDWERESRAQVLELQEAASDRAFGGRHASPGPSSKENGGELLSARPSQGVLAPSGAIHSPRSIERNPRL